jgi:hypothetical protein
MLEALGAGRLMCIVDMAHELSSGWSDSVADFSRVCLSAIAQWTVELAEAAINDG